MRAVTERRIFRRLALAETKGRFFGNFKLTGLQSGALVGAVAKRAVAGAAAGTPPISAWFKFNLERSFLGWNGFFRHGNINNRLSQHQQCARRQEPRERR